MNIVNAQCIDGWMKPEELEWLAKQASTRKKIVEVGSWMGRSTRAIMDNTEATVYAVDTWNGSNEIVHKALLAGKPEDWLFNKFISNMDPKWFEPAWKLRPYRGTSIAAADYLGKGCYNLKFDMIFLDASHDYANVKQDIQAWLPNLAEGGLLCGHDWSPNWPGVVKAVRELLPTAKKVGEGSLWAF